MLAQLWNGGYVLDWSGLVCEFAGAALAAFAILPRSRDRSARGMVDDGLRASDAFLILQWGQIKLGFVVLALGCLLQCAGTFQAALPLFAN
jgi:hypothetical protein